MHERQRGRHVMQIGFVDVRRFVTQQTCLNVYACRTQVSKAFSGNLRIAIFDGRNDTLDARSAERVGAGGGAAVMCVWFERDVSGAAACFFTSDLKRNGLSVF